MSHRHRTRGRLAAMLAALPLVLLAAEARAEDRAPDLESLERQIEELRRRDAEKEKRIEGLEQELRELKGGEAAAPAKPEPGEAALDRELEALETPEQATAPPPAPGIVTGQLGGATLRLIDISLDALAAAGGSTADDESLETLQAGGHDPRQNGFTLQNVELSGIGAVDPYVSGESHFIFFLDPENNETVVELEEAFLTTQSLPWGLQVEAGHFFTEFGRLNPTHPHAWKWQDQPIINSRLFGPDGMRNPGFRVGWLVPVPWFSQLHLGMQDATGGTMPSFLGGELGHAHGGEEEAPVHEGEGDEHAGEGEEEPPEGEEHDHLAEFEPGIGGRPIVRRNVRSLGDFVYLARLENALDLTPAISGQIGLSGLIGPNATGHDGETRIGGADLVVKWRPASNFRGWPFFLWESEIMVRDFDADHFIDAADPDDVFELSGKTLHDWGFYTQGLYGLRWGWAGGVRFEYASGSGESLEGGRASDPFRDDRFRFSPLAVWQPSEFSRFRLQYNYDDAEHLPDGDAQSVWFGIEFLYGAHPAHSY